MVEYLSVAAFAAKCGVSERTVRNYCANRKLEGAYLIGKTWNIPAHAVLPQRCNKMAVMPLLKMLREQKEMKLAWSIYHKMQIHRRRLTLARPDSLYF